MPFPHVEQRVMTVRPAFVLTAEPIGPDASLIWTAMITNAARPDWPDDVFIDNWQALGLIIPSKVRTAKVATSEVTGAVLLGRASPDLVLAVASLVTKHLGH